MAKEKVKVQRAASDVSPKVTLPSLATAIAVLVTWITSGEYNDVELALSIAAVAVFAIGYFKSDVVEV